MDNYIISYDIGTTGIKTCVFDINKEIKLIGSAIESYSLQVLDNGGVEQNPNDWFDAMCRTTKEVIAKNKIDNKSIKGISFCAQMQGLVLVDNKGKAIRPAMSYMDNRAFNEFENGIVHGLKISGMNITKLLSSIKITGAAPASIKDPLWKYKWVEENEPEVFKKVYKWLDIKEYLICRLTNEFIMTEDSAFATMLFDLKEKVFSKKICKLYGINYSHMPKVIKSTDCVGNLSKKVAKELGLHEGTKVFGGGGDASLVAIGAGAVDLNDTHIYIGTSGWVSTVIDKKVLDIKTMIASIQGASSRTYNYFAELETAGKCLEWVKDHLALDEIGIYLDSENINGNAEVIQTSLYDYMMNVIKDIPAGSNGVIFTPWLHGNRCPFEDHNARGIFFNIGLNTGKTEMIHSVLEGVCYHLRWQLEASEKKIKTSETIRFVGGGAIAPLTCQILSDILDRTIETVDQPQNIGSVGATIVAGVGLNIIPDIEAAKSLIKVKNTYKPNKHNTLLYNKYFKVFKDLYHKNKRSFNILNN